MPTPSWSGLRLSSALRRRCKMVVARGAPLSSTRALPTAYVTALRKRLRRCRQLPRWCGSCALHSISVWQAAATKGVAGRATPSALRRLLRSFPRRLLLRLTRLEQQGDVVVDGGSHCCHRRLTVDDHNRFVRGQIAHHPFVASFHALLHGQILEQLLGAAGA